MEDEAAAARPYRQVKGVPDIHKRRLLKECAALKNLVRLDRVLNYIGW